MSYKFPHIFESLLLGARILAKVGDQNTRVQRWLEFLTTFVYGYALEYSAGSANSNTDILSRLP